MRRVTPLQISIAALDKYHKMLMDAPAEKRGGIGMDRFYLAVVGRYMPDVTKDRVLQKPYRCSGLFAGFDDRDAPEIDIAHARFQDDERLPTLMAEMGETDEKEVRVSYIQKNLEGVYYNPQDGHFPLTMFGSGATGILMVHGAIEKHIRGERENDTGVVILGQCREGEKLTYRRADLDAVKHASRGVNPNPSTIEDLGLNPGDQPSRTFH